MRFTNTDGFSYVDNVNNNNIVFILYSIRFTDYVLRILSSNRPFKTVVLRVIRSALRNNIVIRITRVPVTFSVYTEIKLRILRRTCQSIIPTRNDIREAVSDARPSGTLRDYVRLLFPGAADQNPHDDHDTVCDLLKKKPRPSTQHTVSDVFSDRFREIPFLGNKKNKHTV